MTTIIAGTNRPDSYTLKLAEYYQRKLNEYGEVTELLSLTDLPDGLIHPEMYEKHKLASWEPIQELISKSTKFMFIIPEYNGSYPGILKLFIDACKFPESFSGKKAALVGVSSGTYGNIRGVEHFTGVCHYININVLPLRLHIPYINKEFNEDGNLFAEDTVKFTNKQIKEFLEF